MGTWPELTPKANGPGDLIRFVNEAGEGEGVDGGDIGVRIGTGEAGRDESGPAISRLESHASGKSRIPASLLAMEE
jgi:hypothetical protein